MTSPEAGFAIRPNAPESNRTSKSLPESAYSNDTRPESFSNSSGTKSYDKSEQHRKLSQVPGESNAVADGTPEPSQASYTASVHAGPGNIGKKVEFSAWTTSSDVSAPAQIRLLPPSRESRSPNPILKSAPYSSPPSRETPQKYEDKEAILEANLHHLFQDDLPGRLEAYATLSSVLKVSSDFIHGPKRKQVLRSLLVVIKKDLERRSDAVIAPFDTNLVLHALKLLTIIASDETLAEDLADGQWAGLLDHSITTLEERKASKAILLHYLHFLSTQDFSKKIMTVARAIRLLEAMKDIPQHVRGKGIMAETLMVYHRVLPQARNAFRGRPSCWVGPLLAGLTSPIANTRTRAIHLGNRAALLLGPSSSVAITLRGFLETSEGDQDVLSSTICKRLIRMLRQADETRHVPQAWAVIMLLMGGLGAEFQQWDGLHDWLRVIQKSFNCGDAEVRIEANKAWNKLVYVLRPQRDPKSLLSKMMIKPILVQMQRSTSEKQSKRGKDSAFASYCNLLYYDLIPSASFECCDAIWDEHVAPALRGPFLADERNTDRACRILMSLCWKARALPWREKRALEADGVEPEQIPLLDCRWIRSRISSVLGVFKTLFCFGCWGVSSNTEIAPVALAWQNLAKALSQASQKEIIASIETTEAIRHLSQFLVDICQSGPTSLNSDEVDFASRFYFMCKTMVSELGPIHFLDGFLPNTADRSVPTRHSSISSESPGALIFDLLKFMRISPPIFASETYSSIILDLVQCVGKACPSPLVRIRFYRWCSKITLPPLHSKHDKAQPRTIWNAIANAVCSEMALLETNAPERIDMEDVTEDVVMILEQAVPYQAIWSEAWSSLMQTYFRLAKGVSFSTYYMVKRLGACLRFQTSDESRRCTAALLSTVLPSLKSSISASIDRPQQSATKKVLSEDIAAHSEMIYLLHSHLAGMYGTTNCYNHAEVESLIDALILLLQFPLADQRLSALRTMQDSLTTIFRSDERLQVAGCESDNRRLKQSQKLRLVVVDGLRELSSPVHVQELDTVFSALFNTPCQKTFSAMVKMWKSTYENKQDIVYGARLQAAISRLKPFDEADHPDLHGAEARQANGQMGDDQRIRRRDERSAQSSIADIVTKDDHMAHEGQGPEKDRGEYFPASTETAQVMSQAYSSNTPPDRDHSPVRCVSPHSSLRHNEAARCQSLTADQDMVLGRQDKRATALLPTPEFMCDVELEVAERSVVEATHPVFANPTKNYRENWSPGSRISLSPRSVSEVEAGCYSPSPQSTQRGLSLVSNKPLSSPNAVIEASEGDYLRNGVDSPSEQQAVVSILDEDARFDGPRADTNSCDLFTKALDDVDPNPRITVDFGRFQCQQASSDVLINSLADTDQASTLMPMRPTTEDCAPESLKEDDPDDHTVEAEVLAADEPKNSPGQSPLMAPLADTPDNAQDVVSDQEAGSADDGIERGVDTIGRSITDTVERAMSMVVSGDDLDFWSASQLSGELETAASSALTPCKMPQVSPDVHALGKRKSPTLASPERKRRKCSGGSAPSRGSGPIPSGRSDKDSISDEEVLDCTESTLNGSPTVEVSTYPTLETRGPLSPTETNTASSDSDQSNVSDSGLFDVCGNTNQGSGAGHVSVGDQEAQHEDPVTAGEAMQLLQEALSLLRHSSMDRSELRAIDDAVFEIRIEAHNALRRSEEKGC